jgi:hypothetical protein
MNPNKNRFNSPSLGFAALTPSYTYYACCGKRATTIVGKGGRERKAWLEIQQGEKQAGVGF